MNRARELAVAMCAHRSEHRAVLRILPLVGRLPIGLDVARYRAWASLGMRQATPRRRRALIARLMRLPRSSRERFASFWARALDLRTLLTEVERTHRRLKHSRPPSVAALEASLELAFGLVVYRQHARALRLLSEVSRANKRGRLLIDARIDIIRAGCLAQRASAHSPASPRDLNRAIRYAERARELLGDEIFADPLFLAQALNNQAYATSMLGRKREAMELYQRAAESLRAIDQARYVQALTSIAAVATDVGRFDEAQRALAAAFRAKLRDVPSDILGRLSRAQAQVHALAPDGGGPRAAAKAFARARQHFSANPAELRETAWQERRVLQERPRQAGKVARSGVESTARRT